jgi:hypothetical protein
MAINEKWARWTQASVAKHLLTASAADSELIVVTGSNPIVPGWEDAASQYEATVTSYNLLERSKGWFLLSVSIFAIVSSLRANGYDHAEAVGKGQKWLNACIRILDYGDTDSIELATLKPLSGPDGTLDTINLKPAKTDDRLHSTISASYSARFKA